MCHPSRVHGIFTINNTATISMGRFMERLKVSLDGYVGFSSLVNAGEDEGNKIWWKAIFEWKVSWWFYLWVNENQNVSFAKECFKFCWSIQEENWNTSWVEEEDKVRNILTRNMMALLKMLLVLMCFLWLELNLNMLKTQRLFIKR